MTVRTMTAAGAGALMLAACSGGEASAPTAPATPAIVAPSVSVEAPVPVKPGPTKTFGDWYVGCDNNAICTMASLGGGGSSPLPDVTLAITRAAGPGGGYELAFDVPGDRAPVAPVAVKVDGHRLALPALTGAAAATLVAAMTGGRTMTVLEANDRPRATLSLKGAAAALRWIDERQGRVDTITAAVAKGTRPADAVPVPPRAPVVGALTPGGVAAKPTRVQFAAMRKRARCERLRKRDAHPDVHALGGGATLVLVPCSTGAYNRSSALFVLAKGAWRPAATDAPSDFGPTPAEKTSPVPGVVNAIWQGGALTSHAKARGRGDCGVAQTFVWDGTRLRLSEQSVMGECRGNPNYIATWRTRVVRR